MEKMKKIHDIPELLEKLFNTKPFAMVFSIICAILIWFSVSVTIYKTTHVVFYDVPVSAELTGTIAEANGLSAVSCDVESVTVELEGNRSQIGRLTREDLTACLQVGNISTTGEFQFEIGVQSDMDISFSISSVKPAYATVKLDKIETRTFDITASFPNVHVSAGHTLDHEDVICEPPVVEITGPSAQLNEIARVEVWSDKSVEIDSLYSLYTDEIRLYTEEGARLDTDYLEFPSTSYQITIPVLTQKELPLTYDIRNAPSGFDLKWLREKLHLSQDTITLASQTNTDFVNQDGLTVGYVALNEISLDFSKDLDIELKEDLINQSGFQKVTLALDNEGLDAREVWVTGDNIFITNTPKDYDCQIITRSMPVTVVGPEEELDELSTQDIIVTVDLMNYNVAQSMTGTPDATISFYNKADENHQSRLWAVGNYRVAVSFSETEETIENTEESLTEE